MKCIVSRINEALTEDDRAIINRLIEEEIYRAEKVFNCALRDLEKSETLGDYLFNLNKINNIFFDTWKSIADKRWSNLRFKLIRRGITKREFMYFLSIKLEKFLLPHLNRAMELAKSIGQKLGVETITVAMSLGVTGISIQIGVTVKV